MRRIMLAASVMAMMLVFSAVPALADDGDDHWEDRLEERFFDGFFFEDDFFFFDDNEDFDGGVFEDGIVQETEQDAESGDIDQTFDVSGTGDNSNQTVGTQGVANTGNAQNVIDVVDAGDFNGDFDGDDNGRFFLEDDGFFFEDDFFFFEDDDFFRDFDGDGNGDIEFEDVGSTIELSPTQTTTSDQQVNQAASAFGW